MKTKQQQIDDLWKRLEDNETRYLNDIEKMRAERDKAQSNADAWERLANSYNQNAGDAYRTVENLVEALNVMTEKQLETRSSLRSRSRLSATDGESVRPRR